MNDSESEGTNMVQKGQQDGAESPGSDSAAATA
jgi:hypothetical protein